MAGWQAVTTWFDRLINSYKLNKEARFARADIFNEWKSRSTLSNIPNLCTQTFRKHEKNCYELDKVESIFTVALIFKYINKIPRYHFFPPSKSPSFLFLLNNSYNLQVTIVSSRNIYHIYHPPSSLPPACQPLPSSSRTYLRSRSKSFP